MRVIPGSCHYNDSYMHALHDNLQSGKGTVEEMLGVSGPELPGLAVETIPGDIVCFGAHSSTPLVRS